MGLTRRRKFLPLSNFKNFTYDLNNFEQFTLTCLPFDNRVNIPLKLQIYNQKKDTVYVDKLF